MMMMMMTIADLAGVHWIWTKVLTPSATVKFHAMGQKHRFPSLPHYVIVGLV